MPACKMKPQKKNEDEKEPIEKITLLDVLTDLGLQDEVESAVGAIDITLRPSSIFACVNDEAFKTRLVSHCIPWDAGPTKCSFDFLLNEDIEKHDVVALRWQKELFQKLRDASHTRKEAFHPPSTYAQWSLMKDIFEIRHEEGNFSCFLQKPDFSNPNVPPKAVIFGPNFVLVPPGRFCSKLDQLESLSPV